MPDPGLDLPNDAEQSPNFPFAVARSKYILIRKPSESGAVVGKIARSENAPRLPKALHEHGDFVVTYPGSKGALDAATVDQASANLTQKEWDILAKAGVTMFVSRPDT